MNFCFLSFVFLLKLLVTVCSQAGETNCAERIRAYLGCVKGEENERRAAALKESDGIINDQIASCFTGLNCSAPNFIAPLASDLSTGAQKLWTNLTSWWDGQASDRRLCVISELRGNFRSRLEECVRVSMPSFTLKSSRDDARLSAEENFKVKKIAEFRLRLRLAERNCQEVDSRNGQLLLTCINDVRLNSVEQSACALRRNCAKLFPLTCQSKWSGGIRSTICNCVTQVAEELQKTKIVAKPIKDEEIKTKCGVELPHMDVSEIRANPVLLHRIRDFVALHEDRLVPLCHDCPGVPVV